jgi:hypothetical protein
MSSSIAEFDPHFQWAVNQTLAQCGRASVGSGYRTIEEQRALLYKRAQGILVADPGTSRHEGNHFGAVDMEGDLDCFAAVGARYGLTNQDVPGELWHFQFTSEAEQAVIDGTYAEQYGMTELPGQQEQEPEPDSLDGIRELIMGGGQNPDVPDRVAEGLAEAERPAARRTAAPEASEGFVPQASAGFTSDGSSLSAIDVAKVYAQAGFTGDALVTMVAIAKGESGWNPGAHGDTSITTGTWGPSIGLSQIRSLNAERGTGGWRDPERLSDPLFNARAAYAISNGGTNFGPWTVYSKGLYQQYVGEAKAAVAALGTGSYAPAGAPPAASLEPEDDDGLDPDFTLSDPAGMMQEIADMMLQNRKGPGEVLDRVNPDEEADEKLEAFGGL